jgi:hypothetical protein
MQYVSINEEVKNGKICYVVNAIPLKNSSKSIVQKIPHPCGTDALVFDDIEDAKGAILRAGFSYILPDGKKGGSQTLKTSIKSENINYEQIVYDAICDKVNSTNISVSASAILAISEFPSENTFDILFNKLGEENDIVRKNAIAGIARYGNLVIKRIIESLKSQNWVERNSAISCIALLCENKDVNLNEFILPLTEVCDDTNSIVQSNALTVIAKVYQTYMKHKKV